MFGRFNRVRYNQPTYVVTAVPAALPSDRAAYAAIRDLLTATREFDAVLVGRAADATPIPAKWGAYAVLTPLGDPRSIPDGTPTMRASTAAYRLQIAVRTQSARDDERAYQTADRLKGVCLSALLHPDRRAYAGFCSPWLSDLVPTGDPVKAANGAEWRVELRGSFTFPVNLRLGYSTDTARV